jgi:outer membrane protein assembly factor BamB
LTNTPVTRNSNGRTGKPRWEKDLVKEHKVQPMTYMFGASPVVEGDLLLLNVNTAGIALNKRTGDVVWMSSAPGGVGFDGDFSTPMVYTAGGTRCALMRRRAYGLTSVEVATGKVLWTFPWLSLDAADPQVINGRVFLEGEKGVLSSGGK